MATIGKKFRTSAAKVDRARDYGLSEACALERMPAHSAKRRKEFSRRLIEAACAVPPETQPRE